MLSLEAGVLSMFILEGIKFAIRHWVVKDLLFEFPALYYTLLIPFLTALVGFGLGFIGWADPIVLEWAAVGQWAIAIVVQLAAYHMGLQPFKQYARSVE